MGKEQRQRDLLGAEATPLPGVKATPPLGVKATILLWVMATPPGVLWGDPASGVLPEPQEQEQSRKTHIAAMIGTKPPRASNTFCIPLSPIRLQTLVENKQVSIGQPHLVTPH